MRADGLYREGLSWPDSCAIRATIAEGLEGLGSVSQAQGSRQ